ncbi:hypothetical protein [Rhizobium oryzicola]|uniref:Uncharacterized protein n=1 Tax=Rhizobium oryzicola TaxID=1232668 RepID=A0ABT8T115_9HYPH|nr:hypothetical protein [Rhizobium oryzicola]MDO1584445.1 hypothetical protein [Rhizobium oryzicola]
MKISLNFANPIRHILITLGLLVTVVATAAPASAEYIYRGLLTDKQGALDLRTARFPFNPTLSFNKSLANIAAAPSGFKCALRLNTAKAIPQVGDSSTIVGFGIFTATFDQALPTPPAGHVSVTPSVPATMPNPAQQFANDLKATALANPGTFADTYIVGVPGHESDDDCRDRPKSFN